MAATLFLPAGIWLLTWLDRETMRWVLAVLVVAAVAVMASGWRYQGRPTLRLSLGVGACSGLFNGMASIGGLPLAVFWLGAQRSNRHRTRTNLRVFVGASALVSGTLLWWKGILAGDVLLMALPLLAIYGVGLWAGAHAFRLASEASFRRAAYVVILAGALVSLPLWDASLGR
ncbi:TSUP family transporter [Methylobacterium sp. CB376]|uniref:TSUP family transporter n=1 Tax=unclassified Methylobacterium TaxID=2615210 RepID=UPI0014392B31|nr:MULTISPECIES: TSUP family transporter [Methylobacterium]WFT80145.1 TSUP family transporter [Methylobacterium nodulans]